MEILLKTVVIGIPVAAFCVAIIRKIRAGSADRVTIEEPRDPYEGRRIRVAIVDDEAGGRFDPAMRDRLLARGFQIEYFDDILQVEKLAPFPVVLCDFRGVGRALTLGDGAHGGILVKEIRQAYPLKYLVIYSAGTWDDAHNQFYRTADMRVRSSDLQGEKLVELLEEIFRKITSANEQWRRISQYILVPEMLGDHLPRRIRKQIERLKRTVFDSTPMQLASLDVSAKLGGLGCRSGESDKELLQLVTSASEIIGAALESFRG